MSGHQDVSVIIPANTPEVAKNRHKTKKVKWPQRKPSIPIASKKPVYVTADKTTCAECLCFPKDSTYDPSKPLLKCQTTPLTLYELAAWTLDRILLPKALSWTIEEVAKWMSEDIGYPQYRKPIERNAIDGMRLVMLEDASSLPLINIHYHEHISNITDGIRRLYSMEMILYFRSISLPPRKPWTHFVQYRSRTGPPYGDRRMMVASSLFRKMHIIDPEPVRRSHWEMVWYRKPDYPRTLFGNTKPKKQGTSKKFDSSREYQVPRRFRLMMDVDPEHQMIWKQHGSGSQISLPKDYNPNPCFSKPRTPKPILEVSPRKRPYC